MQTHTLNEAECLLDSLSSIYDFSQTVDNPYQDSRVEESLYQHWNTVGKHLQRAMNDFDHEQKAKHSKT